MENEKIIEQLQGLSLAENFPCEDDIVDAFLEQNPGFEAQKDQLKALAGMVIRKGFLKKALKEFKAGSLFNPEENESLQCLILHLARKRIDILKKADSNTVLESFLAQHSDRHQLTTQKDLLQTFLRQSELRKAIDSTICVEEMSILIKTRLQHAPLTDDHIEISDQNCKLISLDPDREPTDETDNVNESKLNWHYLHVSPFLMTSGLATRLQKETYLDAEKINDLQVPFRLKTALPPNFALFWANFQSCELESEDLKDLSDFIAALPENHMPMISRIEIPFSVPPILVTGEVSVKLPVLDLRDNPISLFHKNKAQKTFLAICQECYFVLVSGTGIASNSNKHFLKKHINYSMKDSFRLIFLDEFEYASPFWHSWFNQDEKKFITEYHEQFYDFIYSEVVEILESFDGYDAPNPFFA